MSRQRNTLLTVEEVDAAMRRHLSDDAYTWSQKRLGVDVGDDRTVLFPRQGLASFRPIVMHPTGGSAVSVDVATRVAAAKAQWGSELEFADATAGACDMLRAIGIAVIDVQLAGAASDPRYKNRRTEIWFAMRDWIQHGGALPPIPELIAELTEQTYTVASGKFLLEDQNQIKLADALALTFGFADMARSAMGTRGSVGRALMESYE